MQKAVVQTLASLLMEQVVGDVKMGSALLYLTGQKERETYRVSNALNGETVCIKVESLLCAQNWMPHDGKKLHTFKSNIFLEYI